MKLLLENWRKFLKEYDEPTVITFDFDDTLSLSHWDDEVDWWVHDGPYDLLLEQFKEYKNQGHRVYIVTSRHKSHEDNTRPSSITVEEFVKRYGLSPDGIIFTDGQLKVATLQELGSTLHHDDDPDEIEAAKVAGIETVISDPYGDYPDPDDPIRETLADEDSDRVSKVVIYDKNNKTLLLKRADGRNDWDLPGGHVKNSENYEEGAVREVKEETNLDVSDLKRVDKHGKVRFFKCPCPKGTISLQPEEHIDFKWVNPRDITQYKLRKSLKSAILSTLSLVQEDFQEDVKKNYSKLKFKLIGQGKNRYNIGGKMKKPSYKRSKSAPVGFGGS